MAEDQICPRQGQLLVYRTEDGPVKIDVRLENETVWLMQQQMAELFQTTQQNISLHAKTENGREKVKGLKSSVRNGAGQGNRSPRLRDHHDQSIEQSRIQTAMDPPHFEKFLRSTGIQQRAQ